MAEMKLWMCAGWARQWRKGERGVIKRGVNSGCRDIKYRRRIERDKRKETQRGRKRKA